MSLLGTSRRGSPAQAVFQRGERRSATGARAAEEEMRGGRSHAGPCRWRRRLEEPHGDRQWYSMLSRPFKKNCKTLDAVKYFLNKVKMPKTEQYAFKQYAPNKTSISFLKSRIMVTCVWREAGTGMGERVSRWKVE